MILYKNIEFDRLIGHHQLTIEEIEEQVDRVEHAIKRLSESTYTVLKSLFE